MTTTGAILNKKVLEGDPCGGESFTVGFVDQNGGRQIATVEKQCTGDDRPGQSLDIVYDPAAPSHAVLASDPNNYAREDFNFGVIATGIFAGLALLGLLSGFLVRRAGGKQLRASG